MINEAVFVPKVLLCGDAAEFLARVGQRPFELVGQIKFVGEVDGQPFNFLRDGKFALDEKFFGYEELPKVFQAGLADFLVFNESADLDILAHPLSEIGCQRAQVVTAREFKHLPTDEFCDMYADIQLLKFLKKSSIKTLLDADAHFVKSRLFTKAPNDLTEIDCICREDFLPLKENIFRRVYKNFSDCALKRYDAALIAERPLTDFYDEYFLLEHSADLIITFVRNGSELAAHVQDMLDGKVQSTANTFAKVDVLPSFAGTWLFCYRRKPPEDFAMYVVTHKKLSAEHVHGLPEGYRIIHAGHAQAKEDFGYAGDDTGDNISALNPYINELTAVYWMWKNTAHTIIGHGSYRRFFTTAEDKPIDETDDFAFAREKILTADEAIAALADCDIVVTRLVCQNYPQLEEIKKDVGEDAAKFAATIMKKHIVQTRPDYVDAFDCVINSPSYYQCHMFITRRNIFDAYCKWLFPFVLDALNEVLEKTTLAKFPPNAKRLMGFFAERMFTVWLIKNRLRVKELNKMLLL